MDADSLMKDLGGCGPFQVFLGALMSLAKVPASFNSAFMAFGNYNPGWVCLDNRTLDNATFEKFKECTNFETCHTGIFNPETSTIVTEWGLVCDKAWISNVIISLQMSGFLLGSYLGGYLGDRFGRKRTYCLNVLLNAVFKLIANFSTSWHMYAVMRFLIGLTHAGVGVFPFILASEFSTPKWRSIINSLPTYGMGAIIFATCATLTKDWRQVQLISAIIAFAIFLPSLWAPESIRWLLLKRRKNQVIKVTKKVAKCNRRNMPDSRYMDEFWETTQKDTRLKETNYSWRHLWKGQSCKYTLIFTPIWFTLALTYYAISFGVKSFSGNFYMNLMIAQALEVPVFFIGSFTPNVFGRKKATLFLSFFCTLCLFIVVGLDRLASSDVKGMGTLILAMSVKVAASSEWYIIQVFQSELYPTVIRSTGVGYGSVIARIGGIVAPFLIPKNPDTFYISYCIMAGLTLVCSLLILLLPETRGNQLPDKLNTKECQSSNTADTKIDVPLATYSNSVDIKNNVSDPSHGEQC